MAETSDGDFQWPALEGPSLLIELAFKKSEHNSGNHPAQSQYD
jgi:hypothetical protein